jgi:hypothetical protein
LYPDDAVNQASLTVFGKSRVINNRQGSTYKRVQLNENSEKTLVIIKPDVVAAGHVDEIKKFIQKNGFQIVQQQELTLPAEKAAEFYKEHDTKSYFNEFIQFMSRYE